MLLSHVLNGRTRIAAAISAKLPVNCSHAPLLRSSKSILPLCPPDPLHLKLGITNLLIRQLLQKYPLLEDFLKESLQISLKPYHGSTFDGRQCSKILNKANLIKEVVHKKDFLIITGLHLFQGDVDPCFGTSLKPDYAENIANF